MSRTKPGAYFHKGFQRVILVDKNNNFSWLADDGSLMLGKIIPGDAEDLDPL